METINELRIGILVAEVAFKKMQMNTEIANKEKAQALKLMNSKEMQSLKNNKAGLITDYLGMPIKIEAPRLRDGEEPKELLEFRIEDPSLNIDTARYWMKRKYNRRNTEEAIKEFHEKKRQEKAKQRVPSYLGGSSQEKKKGEGQAVSLDDQAVKMIREHKAKEVKASLTERMNGTGLANDREVQSYDEGRAG